MKREVYVKTASAVRVADCIESNHEAVTGVPDTEGLGVFVRWPIGYQFSAAKATELVRFYRDECPCLTQEANR